MLLNLACDEDNNDSGNGDKATPDPKSTTISVPENLSSDETSSTDGAYELSWDKVSGATTYKLREGETELELSSDDIQNRTHSVTDKDTGSYDYQVQACDASGTCSEWSDAITVHVFTSDPPTLTFDETTPGDGDYNLSWNAVSDDATYILREGDRELELSSDTTTTHSVTRKETGSYNYRVQACHTNGVCSDWSSVITVNVFVSRAPTLTFDETSPGDGDYELSWDMVDNATTYKLQEGTTEICSSAAIRTYNVTGKVTGSYNYQVRACHTNGACSDWSSVITVNVFVSRAPTWTSTETTSGDGSYTLTWDRLSGDVNYELHEGQEGDSESYRRIYLGPNPTPDDNPSGKTDGSYSYRVRACHTNTACTPWSDPLSVLVYIDCTAKTSPQTSGFNDGDGSETSPFLICSYAQLAKMRENSEALTKHYKLGAHIDASDSLSAGGQRDGDATPACTAYDSSIPDGTAGHAGHGDTCAGWAPVGTSTAFTGSLQGGGYTIRNLYISIETTTTHVGLFGQTGSTSLIQNVGMTNAFIRVDTANSRAGGLVGRNIGRIRNSYATGTVIASLVGGLVGWNSNGSISNSYATGSVTGTHAGGLVGTNATGNANIRNSYATASVIDSSGSTGSNLGGLVGYNNTGSISNSYATGSVSASGSSPSVGGLVGHDVGVTGRTINNSYATGSVSASGPSVGGLVGQNGGLPGSTITGTNYFVDSDGGTNGLGTAASCAGTCTRATDPPGDSTRQDWLQDTLNERDDMGWSEMNWEGFEGSGIGYPKLKYAQVSYCSDGSDKDEDACTAAGTCRSGSGSNRDACVEDGGMWTSHTWLTEGCGGSTGVRCGTRIGGQ